MSLTWLKYSGGSPYTLAINWLAQDGGPLALTGKTLAAHLFATLGDMRDADNALATLTHTQTGASAASLSIPATATASWQSPAAPWWRATVAASDGTIERTLEGRLWLTPYVETPYLGPGDVLLVATATNNAATLTVSSPIFLPLITGHVGGTATDLDAIATAAYGTGTLFEVVIGGAKQSWQLQADADAGAASGSAPYTVIQPLDHDATTNARRLVLV